MEHYIVVKFKEEVNKTEAFYQDIKALFSGLTKIQGISEVKVNTNCIARANRYDLMIVITMTKDTLPVYDESEIHKEWKKKYSDLIEKKAIFDCE